MGPMLVGQASEEIWTRFTRLTVALVVLLL